MDATCIGLGFLVSLAVSALKRVPLVSAYPKVTATVLTVALTVLRALPHPGGLLGAFDPVNFAICVATSLSSAIATHEVVIKPTATAVAAASTAPAPAAPSTPTIAGAMGGQGPSGAR